MAAFLALVVAAACAQPAGQEQAEELKRVMALDPSFGVAGVTRVSMSPEADRFVSVAAGPDGVSYGAGFLTTAGDQAMAVARFDENGDLDTSFGQNGFASVNVAPGGKTGERASGAGVQSDGKIVIAGPVEHDPAAAGDAARDTDIAAVRLNEDGTVDTSFGDNGILRLDLGQGRAVEDNFIGDTMFGLTVLEGDELLLVGAKLHDGPDETDRDFAVVRLTADGERDSGFGENGIFVLDIENGNESPRQAVELEDGTVVVSGYTSNGEGVVVPVLMKLDERGKLIEEFGDGGIASAELLPAVAEAYEVGVQGDDFIITGYGRAAEDEKVDLIAARFTSDGQWDREFGEDGLVRLDLAGQDDRGRDLVVLDNGNILIAGSGKPSETQMNGMLVLLTPDGQLEESFGRDGVYQVNLGGRGDSFFSIAIDEEQTAATVAGWSGPEATQGGNEEAVIARIAL
ncbi:MAG TPA: hypothetical protein VHJ78_05340 [Actinomycetota bacterium]|nr:hypothetical protein [Actinomycetota bacterium]